MASDNIFDTRQSGNRTYLQKIASQADFTANAKNTVDKLLGAINNELTPAFNLSPNNPASLILNIGAKSLTNPENAQRHEGQFIDKAFPTFTSGTITLPASSGGTITVSPTTSTNPTLTLAPGNFIKALIEIDRTGNLSIKLGTSAGSEAAATVAVPTPQKLQIGILVIHNTAGVIDNVTGSSIIQFAQRTSLASINEGVTTTVTAAGTTTLTNTSTSFQQFTGTTSQIVKLPDATTMTNGQHFYITNRSTVAVSVNYNDNSLAKTLNIDSQSKIILVNNSTTNGVWDIENSASGSSDTSFWVAAGFQDFIRASYLTAFNGSPGAGQFRSDITGRAPALDPTANLALNMGTNRITFKDIDLLRGEYGPNSESVYKVNNDVFNWFRFVGNWSGYSSPFSLVTPFIGSSFQNSYFEGLINGTGCNLLVAFDPATPNNFDVSIDGGAPTTYSLVGSSVLQGNKFRPIQVINIASGLSPGQHTIKVTKSSANSNTLAINGIEILNTDVQNLQAAPGDFFIDGALIKKLTLSVENYASSFGTTYGTPGTKGARVTVYAKSDSTIGKDIQYVDVTQQTMGSTDHTNEEPCVDGFYFREFGSAVGTDFTTVLTATSKAGNLDDGSTCLASSQAADSNNAGFTPTASGVFYFKWRGSGLDAIVNTGNLLSQTYTVELDGNLVTATLSVNQPGNYRLQIASGLNYGDHTLRVTKNAGGNDIGWLHFIPYRPKSPAIPDNSILINHYDILADFDGTTATGTAQTDFDQNPVGTIFKSPTREFKYTGSWSYTPGVIGSSPAGINVDTLTTTSAFSHQGVYKGMTLCFNTNNIAASDFTLTVDGSLYATATPRGNMTNLTGGSYRITQTPSAPSRLEITGLSYGPHTILVTFTSGTGMDFSGAWLQTVIAVDKFDEVNDGFTGSQTIKDERVFSPIKEDSDQPAIWSEAHGITAGPSTASTSFVPLEDMQVIIRTKGKPIEITFQGSVFGNVGSQDRVVAILVDGQTVYTGTDQVQLDAADRSNMYLSKVVQINPGPHFVQIFHRTGSGTMFWQNTERLLTVKEIK